MPVTAFDVVHTAARRMGVLSYMVSTGGTTTSVGASALANQTADGQFTSGVLFVVESTATSSTPDGQMRRIENYTAAGGLFSLSSSAPLPSTIGLIAARFAYTGPEFSLDVWYEALNDTLRSVGLLGFRSTALQSSANQLEYQLSSTFKITKPLYVEIQGRLGSSLTANEWETVYGWDYRPSTAGATATLVFQDYPPSGRAIAVWYEDYHHRVSQSTAVIDERYKFDLLVNALIEKMYEIRNSQSRGAERFDQTRWAQTQAKLAESVSKWPTWRPRRKPKILALGSQGSRGRLPDPPPWGPT